MVGIIVIVVGFYKDYVVVGRNNKDLVKYIIFYVFYDFGYKYFRDIYFYLLFFYKVLDKIFFIINRNNVLFFMIVLVVGEIVRVDKFVSNGYSRNIMFFMNDIGVVSFNDVILCGIVIVVLVFCMFFWFLR